MAISVVYSGNGFIIHNPVIPAFVGMTGYSVFPEKP